MKNACLLAITLCAGIASMASAQDIESRLSGNTVAQGFTVKVNGGLSLFSVRGNGVINWSESALTTDNGGSIELGYSAMIGSNPYIDFHYGVGSPQDYNFRIMNNNNNSLVFQHPVNANLLTLTNSSVGINTGTPTASLHVAGIDGFLVTGTYGSGAIPATGAGTRLMFYPRKGAFRAGFVDGSQWDDVSVGEYSAAIGRGTIASGEESTAMGNWTTASGPLSTAMGSHTTATGVACIAMGWGTIASGDESTAMGSNTTASGYCSTASGFDNTASGSTSTAMGRGTTASGPNSTAMGWETTASGPNSTAMGSYVDTNNKEGAFLIGDKSTQTNLTANLPNKFRARFANGFDIYTNSAMNLGVYLNTNGTSWVVISDSTKKCGLKLADGEETLSCFSTLRLGSWNYIADQNPNNRHYGALAQEWFAAFGHDGVGTIGNDTTLASADMDGVAYIAIKALEKRTRELQEVTRELRKKSEEISSLRSEFESMKSQVAKLNGMISSQRSAAQISHATVISK